MNKKDWFRANGLCGGYIYISFTIDEKVVRTSGFASVVRAKKEIALWMGVDYYSVKLGAY